MPDTARAAAASLPLAIVAGGGNLPFAVADAVIAQGGRPILFAIRGCCDAEAVKRYRHHWIAVTRAGHAFKLLRRERCEDVVLIGSLVRPALSELRWDWTTLRAMPALAAAFRGGDDHLLSGIAGLVEREGFRIVGVQDVASDLLMPKGNLTRAAPDARTEADIQNGLRALQALGPFDVGQALVVVDGNVVAIEDIGGTDALLGRVANLRQEGRLRSKTGRGVLVKSPKAGQDLRFDLPTFGPTTVRLTAAAGLGGIAIVAGRTLIAEPQAVVADADRLGLFVTGLHP